jgi:preprotein translocase subunit SecD
LRAARSRRSAGAGIIVLSLVSLIGPAVAEPLTLEVVEASVAYDARNQQPIVAFRLAEASRKAFADFSALHVGEKVDLRIDGKSMMQTVIREPITGGVGQIIAPNPDDARQLAARLSSKAARLDVEVAQ